MASVRAEASSYRFCRSHLLTLTSVLGTSRTVVTRSSAAEAYVFTSPADCPAVSRAVMRTLVTFLTASNLTFCQTPLVVVNVPLVTTSLVVPSDSVSVILYFLILPFAFALPLRAM